MATNIYDYEKNFTKNKGGDKMKVDVNPYPNLNAQQKRNINSAYNAKKSGIISEKQYSDNLKKNGVNSGYLNPSANFPKEFKREKSSLENSYNFSKNKSIKSVSPEPIKTPSLTPKRLKVPSEKLEQDRLRNLTGEYNLDKVAPQKLENSIKLKNKTPDDYYRERFDDLRKERERIDEAFGPKTDFSISNFENNYDKMNEEEKGMLIHKMQLEFNRQGYRDKDGFSLKTDGIYGNKTKGVYERYIKDNQDDYKEAIDNKKRFSTSVEQSFITPEEKPQITFASLKKEPNEVAQYTSQKNEKESDIPKTPKFYLQNFSPEIYYSYEEFDNPEDVKKRAENTKIIKKADNVIKDNAEFIKKAAKEYGVNPGILGACIYAEHVLNVDTLDSLTDVFAGNRGVDTSIGVSQVKLSTAKRMEDLGYMPQIKSSADGSLASFLKADINTKRVKALQDPETNIKYAAAYLKYFQDRWKEVYPEIDGRTAILATLFNQDEKKSPHRTPQPNDFGRFARNNYFHINRLLGI